MLQGDSPSDGASMKKKISTFSIIDDDEFFQFTIKKVLQSTDLVNNVLQFNDGKSALNYFLENKECEERLPDIIFLDLNMPLLDGWQFLEEFVKIKYPKKRPTVYICTSSPTPDDEKMYKRFESLKGYFLKPISKKEIYSILDKELHPTFPSIL